MADPKRRDYRADLLSDMATHWREELTSSWPVALFSAGGAVAVLLVAHGQGVSGAGISTAADWASLVGKAVALGILGWYVISIPLAFVRAYNVKHADLQDALRQLQTAREDDPNLVLSIKRFRAEMERVGGWRVAAELNVENAGGQTSRVSAYEAFLVIDGNRILGQDIEINDFGAALGRLLIGPKETLKDLHPIEPGHAHNGFVFVLFSGVPDTSIAPDHLLVRVRDVKRQWTECTAHGATVV